MARFSPDARSQHHLFTSGPPLWFCMSLSHTLVCLHKLFFNLHICSSLTLIMVRSAGNETLVIVFSVLDVNVTKA